jgi:hypothetical protein
VSDPDLLSCALFEQVSPTPHPQPKDDPLVCQRRLAFRLQVSLMARFRALRISQSPHRWAIDVLQDSTFFSKHSTAITSDDLSTLATLSKRWQTYLADGKFRLSVPLDAKLGEETQIGDFWTGPYSYQHMPEKDGRLLAELQKSDLVIFKGDLNYRKWVTWTRLSHPRTECAFTDYLGMVNGQQQLRSKKSWVRGVHSIPPSNSPLIGSSQVHSRGRSTY